jgi:hypothetical protein
MLIDKVLSNGKRSILSRNVTANRDVEGQPSSRAQRGDPGEHWAPAVDRRAAKACLKDGHLSTPYGGSR